MQMDKLEKGKELVKSGKENADIALEKSKTKDIKKLKTLEQLMKEKL